MKIRVYLQHSEFKNFKRYKGVFKNNICSIIILYSDFQALTIADISLVLQVKRKLELDGMVDSGFKTPQSKRRRMKSAASPTGNTRIHPHTHMLH